MNVANVENYVADHVYWRLENQLMIARVRDSHRIGFTWLDPGLGYHSARVLPYPHPCKTLMRLHVDHYGSDDERASDFSRLGVRTGGIVADRIEERIRWKHKLEVTFSPEEKEGFAAWIGTWLPRWQQQERIEIEYPMEAFANGEDLNAASYLWTERAKEVVREWEATPRGVAYIARHRQVRTVPLQAGVTSTVSP